MSRKSRRPTPAQPLDVGVAEGNGRKRLTSAFEICGGAALLVTALACLLPWARFRFGSTDATRSAISATAGDAPVVLLAALGVLCASANRRERSHSLRTLECLLAVACIAYTTTSTGRLLATSLSAVRAGVLVTVSAGLWIALAASLTAFVLLTASLLIGGLSTPETTLVDSRVGASTRTLATITALALACVIGVGIYPPWVAFAGT